MKPLHPPLATGLVLLLVGLAFGSVPQERDSAPSDEQVSDALRKAGRFFHTKVATQGGYVWSYSGDLKLREGEGITDATMIWVQPPATPTVGETFLNAYQSTGEREHLDAALRAASALVRGQMRSGGWYYSIEFDPQKRLKYAYLDSPHGKRQQRKSTLDDDVTQSALRFLMRVDKLTNFQTPEYHRAVSRCLDALLAVQYPNGAWYQWWDDATRPRDGKLFPVKSASYPTEWPRVWPNTWTGRYFLNDNVMANMIETLLQAHDTYADDRYLAGAIQAGNFLLLAQMPAPQPAWAQQYDPEMHPVWDRKFEPPAISGSESQGVMESLLLLYRRTGQQEFLAPIPSALAYLRASILPNGKLARFYELKTNRPLYFTVTGKRYDLTYDGANAPRHYAFQVPSRLDRIEAEYRRLISRPAPPVTSMSRRRPARERDSTAIARVTKIIASMDERGAWVEDGVLDQHEVCPQTGIIHSRTFVQNMQILIDYFDATR